jgi:hypothetical protein
MAFTRHIWQWYGLSTYRIAGIETTNQGDAMKIYMAGAGCGGWPLLRMASFAGRVFASYVDYRNRCKQREIDELREFIKQRKAERETTAPPFDGRDRQPKGLPTEQKESDASDSFESEPVDPVESPESKLTHPSVRTSLYEVEVGNRVVKGIAGKRITGTQGEWHYEKRFYLARSESEAEAFAREELFKLRFLGISKLRAHRGNIRRQVEIVNIRRIA